MIDAVTLESFLRNDLAIFDLDKVYEWTYKFNASVYGYDGRAHIVLSGKGNPIF